MEDFINKITQIMFVFELVYILYIGNFLFW